MAKKPERLQRRSNRYFVRAKVPDELRPLIGKRELKWKLDTSDEMEARERVRVASVEVDAIFADARRKLNRAAKLTDAELHNLVKRWFHERERDAVKAFKAPTNDDERAQAIAACDEDEADLLQGTLRAVLI